MKKYIVLALVVVAFLCSGKALTGQQTPEPSEDQKIEALKKRQLELKRQIREELERQNKALADELDQLRSKKSEPQATVAPVPAPATQPVTTAMQPAAPQNTGMATTPAPEASVGNGNTDGSSTNAAATTNSQANDCAAVFLAPRRFSRAEQAVCFLARDVVRRGGTRIDPNTEDISTLLPALLAQLIRTTPNLPVDAAVKSFVLDVEASRTDKQLGADSRAAGTTSLGVRGGIPQVLSWAVENGAATSSIDGTTFTFRLNPVGFLEALSSQGYVSGFRNTEDDPLASFFRRTSVGFSFDTSRDTNPPTLTGAKRQLSAVSFRYQLVNQRDPRSARYRAKWDNFFQRQGVEFADRQTEQLMKLQLSTVGGEFRNATLNNWLNATNAALAAANIPVQNEAPAIEQVRRIIDQRLGQLPVAELTGDPEVAGALTGFVAAYVPFLTEKNKILDEIAKGTLVTFEYTNYREPTAPDLSNFRFIFDKGMVGGVDFSANASLTFFNKRPVGPDVQRIRDFDFSGQLDKRLDDVMGLGPATLSFTGKYQRLTSNAVAFDGTVLPNTKGDIAAGQIKLTIPIKDSGIKMPFSITFANRTELIRENEVRGNFGFTFDLDTLFAKFKAFTQN